VSKDERRATGLAPPLLSAGELPPECDAIVTSIVRVVCRAQMPRIYLDAA